MIMNEPAVNQPNSNSKKKMLLTSFSFVLTIFTTIICGPIMALAVLASIVALKGGAYGGFLGAMILYGLEFVKYAPFTILIALSSILSLIFLIVDINRTHDLDNSVKNKITKRSLLSAILLFAPAVTYPVAYILRLYEICPFDTYCIYLACGIIASFVIDLVSFIVILSHRKKKQQAIKSMAKLRSMAIALFAVEFILCGGWYYGIVYCKIEADATIKREDAEREKMLQTLRSPSIENELSDVVATKCSYGNEYRQYEIVYSDSRTEGIFKCNIADSVSEVLYAAYYGENGNGKTEISLIELGRIDEEKNLATTSIIGETEWHYDITFINAKDDKSALERAKAYAADATLSQYSSDRGRAYIFHTNKPGAPTTKDYLNAILASNIYLSNQSAGACDSGINWGLNKKKYKCIKAKGDLFQKYINDEDNYSPYSIDALYKNRHLYIAPLKFTSDEDRTGLETEGRFAIFWRKPFTQGKLTFKYLPQEIFDKHDGDLEWEDEDEDDSLEL